MQYTVNHAASVFIPLNYSYHNLFKYIFFFFKMPLLVFFYFLLRCFHHLPVFKYATCMSKNNKNNNENYSTSLNTFLKFNKKKNIKKFGNNNGKPFKFINVLLKASCN